MKSGHPTDTTLGNSVRSAVYAAYLVNNEKYGTFLVAGDDMLIITTKNQLKNIIPRIEAFYQQEYSNIPKALG